MQMHLDWLVFSLSLEELLDFICRTVGGEANLGWAWNSTETLPLTHGIDDWKVSVDSGVNSFFPSSVDQASIATSVSLEGFREWHGLVAACALGSNAFGAVRFSIGDAHRSVVHKGIWRENKFDLPVCIGSGEELNFKTSVFGHIFLDNKNTTFISHVARWRAWVLVIMAIVLNGKALWWGLPVSADWELLGIVWRPNLDLRNIGVA